MVIDKCERYLMRTVVIQRWRLEFTTVGIRSRGRGQRANKTLSCLVIEINLDDIYTRTVAALLTSTSRSKMLPRKKRNE